MSDATTPLKNTGEMSVTETRPVSASNGLLSNLLPVLVALAIAAVVGDLLILSFGEAPRTVYRQLVEGTWGNPYGIGQVLYKATTLTFTGLAFAIAGRAGLFNVGAESQLAMGGFAAGIAGMLLPAGMPGLIAVLSPGRSIGFSCSSIPKLCPTCG